MSDESVELVQKAEALVTTLLWRREQYNGVGPDYQKYRYSMGDRVANYEREAGEIVQAVLSITPSAKVEGALGWLAGQTNLSIEHHSPIYCDDDDDRIEWRVIKRGGSINDREYDCVGRGETPIEAILDARLALAGKSLEYATKE